MFETDGFVVAAELRRSRGDTRTLSLRYERGELVRVRRGIYFDKASWIALEPWERYARTAVGVSLELPGSLFCYETAALIWGLNLVGVPDHIHLAGATASHAGRKPPTTGSAFQRDASASGLERIRGYGVFRHHCHPRAVLRRGLPVTPLPDTIIDVLARSPFAQAVVIADHAISPERFKGLAVTRDELAATAAHLPSEARRRWVSGVLEFANPMSGSAGESLSRANMHLLGLPAPELQAEFHDAAGFVARTDFFWRAQRIIGEFDGDAKYLRSEYLGSQTAKEAVLAEKKREDRLRAMGFSVVRWDWETASNPRMLMRKLEGAGLRAESRSRKIPR